MPSDRVLGPCARPGCDRAIVERVAHRRPHRQYCSRRCAGLAHAHHWARLRREGRTPIEQRAYLAGYAAGWVVADRRWRAWARRRGLTV